MAYVIFSPVEAIGRTGSDAAEGGAKLWFRRFGTTTPVAVYQDPLGASAHANPVVADASGAFPPIYWDNTIRTRVLKTGPAALNPNSPDWQVDDIGPQPSDGGPGEGYVSPRDYGAIGDGTTPDQSALNAATAAALTGGLDVLISEPLRITANTTIPAGVSVTFVGGGMLIPNSGITITYSGKINSNATQRFDISLGGSVSFVSNTVQSVYSAAWWGPDPTNITDTSAIFTALIAATPDRAKITLPRGANYKLSGSISLLGSDARGRHICAEGSVTGLGGEKTGPRFTWAGAANGVVFSMDTCRSYIFEGFSVNVGTADHGFRCFGYDPGITSANTWRDVHCFTTTPTATTQLWVIENTEGNNGEFFIWERASGELSQGNVLGSQVGVHIFLDNATAGSNCHGHVIRDCRFVLGQHAIKGGLGLTSEGINNAYGLDCAIYATNVYETGLYIRGWNLENCHKLIKAENVAGPLRVEHNRLSFSPPSGGAYVEFIGLTKARFSENAMYIPLTGAAVYDCTAAPSLNLTLERNVYTSVGDPSEITDYFKSGTTPRSITAIDDFLGPGCHTWDKSTNGGEPTANYRFQTGLMLRNRGDTDISGTTVTLEAAYHKVSGSPAIDTITLAGTLKSDMLNTSGKAHGERLGFEFVLYGDAGFTTVATGNIASAVTVAAGRSKAFFYDRTDDKVYPA